MPRFFSPAGILTALLLAGLALPVWAWDPDEGQVAGASDLSPDPGNREALDQLKVILAIPRSSPLLAGIKLPPHGNPSLFGRLFGRGTVNIGVAAADPAFADLPMAAVADEAVTLGEFADAFLQSAPAPEATTAPQKLLARLIAVRLVVREGREMGLDQLPEVREMVRVQRRLILREQLIASHAQPIVADKEEVEKLYRESIRESRIKAVVFTTEPDAKDFAAKLAAGSPFADLAGEFAKKSGVTVKGGIEGEYVRDAEMPPAVAQALEAMQVGAVSAVLPVQGGFMVFRLEEVRRLDRPEARKNAEQKALNFARNKALVALNKALTAKYVKLDEGLLNSLDFKKDFDALLKDERVLASIAGGDPVKVSDFARKIKEKYFHGLSKAIEKGRIEEDKRGVMSEILFKEVFVREALARHLDETEPFQREMEQYERSVVFGAFVQKVLAPEGKVTFAQLKAFYAKHAAEYAEPAMVALKGIAFASGDSAATALNQLRKGADFGWLKANAVGQAPANAPDALDFAGALLVTASLPEALQAAIRGAEPGNSRIYHDTKGYYYVLQIERLVPPRTPPLAEVQEDVLKKAVDEKLQAALDEWTANLRGIYGVEVYATGFSTAAKDKASGN